MSLATRFKVTSRGDHDPRYRTALGFRFDQVTASM